MAICAILSLKEDMMSNQDVVQLAKDGRITLPNSLRRKARISVGDLLRAEVGEDGRITLTPIVTVDRDQAYFWTPRWQAGEREAQEDLDTGRAVTSRSMDDFLAELSE
jgi:bifunctional DNA-binding transcriptional regulator/antitoxin component of YhaV-PrlF toxin-antitoxin module